VSFCRKAMLMLRKKKFQESLLDKTDKQLENIERMVNVDERFFFLTEVFFIAVVSSCAVRLELKLMVLNLFIFIN